MSVWKTRTISPPQRLKGGCGFEGEGGEGHFDVTIKTQGRPVER